MDFYCKFCIFRSHGKCSENKLSQILHIIRGKRFGENFFLIQVDAFRLLVRFGADIHVNCETDGTTLLHIAAKVILWGTYFFQKVGDLIILFHMPKLS